MLSEKSGMVKSEISFESTLERIERTKMQHLRFKRLNDAVRYATQMSLQT